MTGKPNPYPRQSGGLTTFAPSASPPPARVVSVGDAGDVEYGHAAAAEPMIEQKRAQPWAFDLHEIKRLDGLPVHLWQDKD